jgi:hypothetical protein
MMGVGFEGLRRVRTVFFSVNWILWWLAYLKCFLSSLWYQRRGEKRMWYCAEGASSHHPYFSGLMAILQAVMLVHCSDSCNPGLQCRFNAWELGVKI